MTEPTLILTEQPKTLSVAGVPSHYPATAGQHRLWLFQKMYPVSTAYHIQGTIRIDEGLQVRDAPLRQIVKILVARHAALRTIFEQIDGTLVQVIRPVLAPEVVEIEVPSFTFADEAIKQFCKKPFDLGRGPLFRMLRVRSADKAVNQITWSFHHIVCDGISLATLSREFLTLAHSAQPTPDDLPKPPATEFADYASWQVHSAERHEAKAYWLSLLKDRPPRLQLPYDFASSQAGEFGCASYTAEIPQAVGAQLKRLAVSSGSTPFIILLSAFTLLLAKLSGERDFLVGVPVSGRSTRGLRDVVGFFVNTVLIRANIGLDQPFVDHLSTIRAQVLRALKYQDFPFDGLVEELGERAEVGHFPLVPVFFNMLTLNEAEVQLAPSSVGHQVQLSDAKLDWTWYVRKRGDQVYVECHYKSSLFLPDTVAYLVDEYIELVARLVSEPQISLESLPLLVKRVPLDDANAKARERVGPCFNPADALTPIECFESVVDRHSQRLALQDGPLLWTYKELDIQRRGIAQVLHSGGIKAGSRVALLFSHGAPMVAAALAVLSVGATFVPLDPQYPKNRLQFLLEDSEADALLADAEHRDLLGSVLLDKAQNVIAILCPDRLTVAALAKRFETRIASVPDQPAYMLYTSGASGIPNGVLQSNRNALYHIRCYAENLRITPEDRLLLVTTYAFDAAVVDIFSALLTGAALCVMDSRSLTTREILRRTNSEAITIFRATPTLLRHLFLDSGTPDECLMSSVRLLVLGGEAIGPREIAIWKTRTNAGCVLVNGLGLAESSLALQYFAESHVARIPQPVPVGHPVGTTRVDLEKDGQIQSHCFAFGEIVIRGDHVALGYWKREKKTSEAFGVDADGSRIFRTGDYGRRWIDGSIRPLGRRDQQSKICGGHVELHPTWESVNPHQSFIVSSEGMRMEIKDLLSELAKLNIRLEVDDAGKLTCHAPKGALSSELRQKIQSYRQQLTLLLVRYSRPDAPIPPLLRHTAEDRIPLTFSQERIWFTEQYSGGGTFYNMPIALRFTGAMNPQRLKQALADLLKRHEALRAVVREDAIGPAIEILEEAVLHICVEDWTASGKALQADRLPARIQDEATKVFDLRHGPLFRSTLIKLGEQDYVLLLTMHHIVSDGWSVGVVLRDVANLYASASVLPALDFSYVDYAVWQRHPETVRFLEGQLLHWKEALLPLPDPLKLPFDHADVKNTGAAGARERTTLSDAWVDQAEKYARAHDVTLFAVLLSALKILLYGWTQQTDVVVGTVSAGRTHHALESVVGCFINSLAIRTRITPSEQVSALLDEVASNLSQAYQHQDCPFEKVIEAVNPPRKGGMNPLFNVALLLQNFPVPERFAEDIETEVIHSYSGGLNLDLRFVTGRLNEEFILCCEYDPTRFKRETVLLLLEAFQEIVSWMVEHPSNAVRDVLSNDLPVMASLCANRAPRRQIVVASTFTAEPIGPVLEFWMESLYESPRVSFAPYAQLFQPMLDPTSQLGLNHDTNIFLLHLVDWLGGSVESAHEITAIAREACADFIRTFSAFHSRSNATNIIVVTPEVWDKNVSEADLLIAALRRELMEGVGSLPGAYLLDGTDALHLYPVELVADVNANRVGHVPYTQEYFTALGSFLSRKIASIGRQPYKVIVADCDNTLWGGVSAEVGAESVEVAGGFLSLQRFLVEQHSQGMLICLCSKNREPDVRAVFERHPAMELTMEHIAATRINWEEKSKNIQSLAMELNLSLESFIFLDDNPIECREVETALPSVLTLNLPNSADEFEAFLLNTWEFDRLVVTPEAAKRGDYYRQSQERQLLQRSTISFEEFLSKLDLEIEILPIKPQELERSAELTQRTSQFNMSTVRRTARELDALLRSSALQGVAAKVRDRFGDYGLTGLALYTPKGDTLLVDTLLLSCRVLGRRVEHHLAHHLSEAARLHHCNHVVFEYRYTERSQPILDFLMEQFGAWSQSRGNSIFFEVPAHHCSLASTLPVRPTAAAENSPSRE